MYYYGCFSYDEDHLTRTFEFWVCSSIGGKLFQVSSEDDAKIAVELLNK